MNANIRLVPVNVSYFNKRGEMGEKHWAVYSIRFLPGENLTTQTGEENM